MTSVTDMWHQHVGGNQTAMDQRRANRLASPSTRQRWLRCQFYSRIIHNYSSIIPDSTAVPIIPKILPT